MSNFDDAIKINVDMFESSEIKELALTMLATLRKRYEELDAAKQRLEAATDAARRERLQDKVEWIEGDIRKLRALLDVVK